MKVFIQQGDVILKSCAIPASAKRIKIGSSFIVEKGEGANTHIVNEVENIEAYEDNGTLYLKVNEPVKLSHEEHGTQVLEVGTYKKVIEREFSYEEMEARKTQD
jgi:hypothetical protein